MSGPIVVLMPIIDTITVNNAASGIWSPISLSTKWNNNGGEVDSVARDGYGVRDHGRTSPRVA
jgi:hypothetical protein